MTTSHFDARDIRITQIPSLCVTLASSDDYGVPYDAFHLACTPKCISPSCHHSFTLSISRTPHVHITPNERAACHIRQSRTGTRGNPGGTRPAQSSRQKHMFIRVSSLTGLRHRSGNTALCQEFQLTILRLLALGYLYSSVSMNLIQPENARAVLAAGCLLGGMSDLCTFAYDVCRNSLSVETIDQWLQFVDTTPSSGDGTATPDLPQTSVFGLYAQRLRDDVFHFLVTLPEVLESTPPQQDASSGSGGSSARDVLLQAYSRVPFELFKSAVESPTFRIGEYLSSFDLIVPSSRALSRLLMGHDTGSDQARFKFAKDAIELRKRGIARGSGAEETVVLAFGGGNFGGSAVHITRKLRKRPLWKVNS